MAYHQLTRKERERVEIYHEEGHSLSVIAGKLGRSKSTISREFRRNSSKTLGYRGEFAQYHAKRRRRETNGNLRKIEKGSILAIYIFDHLRARWSPEDISVKLREYRDIHVQTHEKNAHNAIVKDELLNKVYRFGVIPSLSAKTIYTFIKRDHSEFLRYFSVLSHKKPRPKGTGRKELITDRTWIDERPKGAEKREEIGHWEGDTIVSGCRKKAIATFAERSSGYYLARKMRDRTAPAMTAASRKVFAHIPAGARKSCTNDSGPEFAEHKVMAEELKMTMYFAHPYHSWERPVNERTNRELRRFFPKGTGFAEIEEWELDWAVRLINHKPRKRLGYRTPHEVFHEKLSVAL